MRLPRRAMYAAGKQGPKMRISWIIAATLVLAACAQLPETGIAPSPSTGPAPQILPLDQIRAAAPAEAASTDNLDARANALRARASALRAPVNDPATAARLNASISANP